MKNASQIEIGFIFNHFWQNCTNAYPFTPTLRTPAWAHANAWPLVLYASFHLWEKWRSVDCCADSYWRSPKWYECQGPIRKQFVLSWDNAWNNISIFWRIVRVSPTSALAWDRIGAALARSKCHNHYPVVAAYFRHVRWAGSSTGLPPSIKVAEQRCVNMLVSEWDA